MPPPESLSFPDEPDGFDGLVVFDFVGVGLLVLVGVGVGFGVIFVSADAPVRAPESSLPPAVTVAVSPASADVESTTAVIVCASLTSSNAQPSAATVAPTGQSTFRPSAAQAGLAETVTATFVYGSASLAGVSVTV